MTNKITLLRVSLCIVAGTLSMNSFSQDLGIYYFTDNAPCPHNPNTTVDVQPTNGTFSPYTSVGTACTAPNLQFGNTEWNTGATVDLSEYNEFSITPAVGYELNLSSIQFGHQTASATPCNWHLRSSVDNYAADIFSGETNADWTYPEYFFTGFSGIASEITFRFYVTNIDASTSRWRQDEVILRGTITQSSSPSTWYADVDNDGYGDPANSEVAVTSTLPNAKTVSGDCNDNDNTVYPGATEICDAKDNDCDGSTDEGLAMTTYYTDADMDSYGATGAGTDYCANPGTGFSTLNTDCNDATASINPGATDVPNNGIDEDCIGGDATTATDSDGDGINSTTDCDDNDNTVYPGATEICDAKDNYCDGSTDEGLPTVTYYADTDMDSFGAGTGSDLCADPGAGFSTLNTDCNDVNNAINPSATEIADNSIDEDCNGSDLSTASLHEKVMLVQLQPNPVSYELTINCTEKIEIVKVISSDGKLILNTQLKNSAIDVTTLEPGTYQIEVVFDNGKSSRNSFIKL